MRSVALLLLALLLASPAWGEPRFAAQLDPQQDLVVRRTIVPSPAQPHGEVQVVRRGELVVIQILLTSRVLKRVVAAIHTKEEKRWPQGSDGHAGSLRYRDELYKAVEHSWQAFRQRDDTTDKSQLLAIEFIVGERLNLIALSLPQLDGGLGRLRVRGKQVLAVWSAPRSYVQANSAAIAADNFSLDEQQAAAWLAEVQQEP
ncbi:MAG: hypothetical protein C0624_11210 [Desulfuromonas sp.]|nr:MAG: hypothetical protein C0624_11210 [Desulfuromonas sp.]